MSKPQTIRVKVNENESVTALLYAAARGKRAGVTLILGHGAGGNQLSGFMRLFAEELASREIDTITFNFLYSEKGRGAPDPKAKLESCYFAVIKAALAQKKLKGNRMAIGGKSMGGRIASQVAAAQESETKDLVSAIDALVFLGYPLHPPGKPEQLRDQHLPNVKAPMLFVQGERDPFGTTAEIQAVIKRLRLKATMKVVESGDHSFKVPKRMGSQEEIYGRIQDRVAEWLRERWDAK